MLESLRVRLEEEKRQVKSRIEALGRQDPFSDPDRTNDNAASDSEASEEFNHDRVVAMISELEVQLSAIDGALLRIGQGTYGKCVNCRRTIETDRLKILPTATLCLTCERQKKS